MWEDEPWDEHQWEQFLRENDRRTDRYMDLMHNFLEKHPRPEGNDPEALATWKEKVRAFVDERGWTRDDIALPFLWLEDDEPFGEDEAWDVAFDDAPLEEEDDLVFEDDFEADSFRRLPIYQQAFALSTEVIDWSKQLPGEVKDSALVQFCNNIMQVPAKVAKGHSMGYEQEFIGGNIACVKRSLGFANEALEQLREMKEAPYMDGATYRHLYEDTYEVRNALGVHIQELRGRFNLGID